ncbi:hypothetical protein QBC47DRAFT_191416 [Echria macrotheca]|uniref:2EXR domain-containing protein n=1 Tax=Echria macrotheca TaxID=438768 RepID=A0AAJ0BC51_9PEZI|nr:hypothetical protein QBC47DRAFT_191416 [Echria macrotheca]
MASFTLFRFLPAELRLEIWRQSCQTRVVEVRYSQEQDRCVSTTRPPAILQVCKESRDEGLRACYVRAFGTDTHDAHIYFSPALDVLYIPRWGDLGYADTARDFAVLVRDTAEHVRSLAIDHVKPEIRRPWETYSKFCLMRNFPRLRETFLILADESQWGQGEQVEFVDPRGDRDTIMRLMENVKESFVSEVGPECFDWDMTASCRPCFELVPKAKAHGWCAAV